MQEPNISAKPVWDIAVRLFHWALVISFTTAYLTGDEESSLHTYAGYMVLGLIVFRLIWGFIGTQHARFKDFIYSPARVKAYAKSMLSGRVEHVDGHNPLGGIMVVALLISLALTSITGLKVYGLEGHGPLAQQESGFFISTAQASVPGKHSGGAKENEAAEDLWEDIHEFFANFTVFLIVLHIAGVVVSSRLEKQNLVKAMITGRKPSSFT
ncbi:cytochrome b/b6 domain-containing protein [Methylophaga sp. OBS4]|uniref:cytochrome b/b6 domain-containing protein n=1 Tax=Methylophaga sp. OBS4 TaxID=2991935 RepID=UPI0022515807|nr:cytochrome b/b6 domain-containing protein [Methylophaga sp. OBS4]MCX4186409.1 cytochrome b/b6 domain-containing protein [Methylophaga sp. OBS4]